MTLSELDAVNGILAALGEAEVNSLEGSISQSARAAQNELARQAASVQREQWHWNRTHQITLSSDAITGEVPVPSNCITFRVDLKPWVIIRDGKLWDKREQTFEFGTAQTGTLIEELPWRDIPETAQDYIRKKTARVVYENTVGAQENRQNLYQEELAARAILNNEEAEAARYSILDDPYLPQLHGSQYVPGSPRFPTY